MDASVNGRIEEAITGLPEEGKGRARKDLQEIAAGAELTAELLLGVLQDDSRNPGHRAIALWLSGLARESALQEPIEKIALSTSDPTILWEAVKALCALGCTAGFFIQMLSGGLSQEHRRAACHALGLLRDQEAAPALLAVLTSPHEDYTVRAQAAESLAYLGTSQAVPDLMGAAQDPSPDVRFWAVFALGNLGDTRAVPLLETIKREDNVEVEGWGTVSAEASEALRAIQEARE